MDFSVQLELCVYAWWVEGNQMDGTKLLWQGNIYIYDQADMNFKKIKFFLE